MIDKYEMFNWFVRNIEDWQTIEEEEMFDRILDGSWDVVSRYLHAIDPAGQAKCFYELTILDDDNWEEAYARMDWRPSDINEFMRDMIDEWVRMTLEEVYKDRISNTATVFVG